MSKKMAAVSRQYIFIQSFVNTYWITNVMKTPEERKRIVADYHKLIYFCVTTLQTPLQGGRG